MEKLEYPFWQYIMFDFIKTEYPEAVEWEPYLGPPIMIIEPSYLPKWYLEMFERMYQSYDGPIV